MLKLKLKKKNINFFIKNNKLWIKIHNFNSLYLKTNLIKQNLLKSKVNLVYKNKNKKQIIFFNKTNLFLNFIQIIKTQYKNLYYGWVEILKLEGIGYKFFKVKNNLFMDLGLSHYVKYKIPFEIIAVINKNQLYCFSYNYEKLMQFILLIKYFKKKNSYQLKGLFYQNEQVKLKVGKQK